MLIIFCQYNVFYFKFESTLLIFHKQKCMVNWQAGIKYMIQMRKCFKIMVKIMGD